MKHKFQTFSYIPCMEPEMGLNKMIIDFHVHMLKYDWMQPWVEKWLGKVRENYTECCRNYSSPDNFTELLKKSGIDYAVIFAECAPNTTGVCNNKSVQKFCQDHENLIPFCTINPYSMRNGSNELKYLILDEGFKGLKLYPTYNYFYPNDIMLYPLYSIAEELDIPVVFHTGSSIFENSRIKYGNPIYFDDVTVDFPNLKIVMAHSGRGCWYNEAFLMAQIHPNIYMEISGLPVANLPKYFPALEKLKHKVIYGSDFPGLPRSFKHNIEEFKSLDYSENTKQLVLGQNAASLLGLKWK